MFSIVNNFNINNWNDFRGIKGVAFDRYTFKDIPEINNPAVGYNSKGYTCSCGTTFVAKHAICPKCGNREFAYEEAYSSRIDGEQCYVTPYRYTVKAGSENFAIVKLSGQETKFEELRVLYKGIYEAHPELMNIAKYKYLYDLAVYINNDVEYAAWWISTKICKLVFEKFGDYDLTFSKQIVDMFEYSSQLTSFLNCSEAINMLAFVKSKNYNVELLKQVDIYDLVHNYEKIDAIPEEVITAALKGHHNRLYTSLLATEEMIRKYNRDPKCISMLTYYLERCTEKAFPKVELPIFMEWAMSTNEEVTMDKFYGYLNAHYIKRANINDNFENIIENFDNDPVATLIKLTKA